MDNQNNTSSQVTLSDVVKKIKEKGITPESIALEINKLHDEEMVQEQSSQILQGLNRTVDPSTGQQ
jgi:hypothetical protein